MAVSPRMFSQLCNMWMQNAFGAQFDQGRAALKRLGKAEIRPLQQRRVARFVQIQQPPQLSPQASIGQGVRRHLVAQEIVDDVLGIGNRIQHQFSPVGDDAVIRLRFLDLRLAPVVQLEARLELQPAA